MKKLTKISAKSLGKMFGLLYALLGFIGGAIISIISLIIAATGHPGGWFGLIAIILLPIFYGIMGLVFGFITAWLYNFVAKKVGGIEVEVE